jgi:hypothetical protein
LYKFTNVSEVHAASIMKANALMMEAVSTTQTSVLFHQITRRNNLEDIFNDHTHFTVLLYLIATPCDNRNTSDLESGPVTTARHILRLRTDGHPDVKGCYKYTEQAVADSQHGVVLQFDG